MTSNFKAYTLHSVCSIRWRLLLAPPCRLSFLTSANWRVSIGHDTLTDSQTVLDAMCARAIVSKAKRTFHCIASPDTKVSFENGLEIEIKFLSSYQSKANFYCSIWFWPHDLCVSSTNTYHRCLTNVPSLQQLLLPPAVLAPVPLHVIVAVLGDHQGALLVTVPHHAPIQL